jgi:hypothetical protein
MWQAHPDRETARPLTTFRGVEPLYQPAIHMAEHLSEGHQPRAGETRSSKGDFLRPRENRGGRTTCDAGRRGLLSWALAARWCPVLSVTFGWGVAPMWPGGPLGDHVLVLFLLLGLAWRTVA